MLPLRWSAQECWGSSASRILPVSLLHSYFLSGFPAYTACLANQRFIKIWLTEYRQFSRITPDLTASIFQRCVPNTWFCMCQESKGFMQMRQALYQLCYTVNSWKPFLNQDLLVLFLLMYVCFFKTGLFCVALAALELTLKTRPALNSDLPASASWVLEWKVCTTTPGLFIKIYFCSETTPDTAWSARTQRLDGQRPRREQNMTEEKNMSV